VHYWCMVDLTFAICLLTEIRHARTCRQKRPDVVQCSAAEHRTGIFDARITIISARLEFENGAGTKLDRLAFHAKKNISIPDVVAPEPTLSELYFEKPWKENG